jgi:nitroreductase
MTRSFRDEPVDQDVLDDLCAEALRAPTAGNSAGVRMTTVGRDHVAEYFAVATDATWREGNARFEGLSRCGAVVIVTSRPQDYLARYAQADKASSGLTDLDAWNVPYWHTDAAMATMALLLLLEERGLGAALWGNFRHDIEVLTWAGVGDETLFATVLVGVSDGEDHPSSSLGRDVVPRRSRVRRVDSVDSRHDPDDGRGHLSGQG